MQEERKHDPSKMGTNVAPAIGAMSARFLASSALSLLGNSISSVALPLALLITTGDALAAGTLAIVCMLPQAAAGVVGGAALDVLNRRDVSIVSDLVSAVSVAMLPIVDATVGLGFGWFVIFGLIGAVGDIPGMTARDTLLPAVCKEDGIDMQRFVGISQSVESLVMIVGPSVAAFVVGFSGPVPAFTATAIASALAAIMTLSIPREVGKTTSLHSRGWTTVVVAARSTKSGLRTLFFEDPFLKSCVIFTLLIASALGGFQGLILPVHFVELDRPDLLGFVLTSISIGLLVGTSGYSLLAKKLRNRAWYVTSLLGMLFGMAIMSALPDFALLLSGAAILGFFSGPFSALLGCRMLETIPEEARGSILGVQNSLLLVASPASIFAASALTSVFGVGIAAAALGGTWCAFTIYALRTKSMHAI